MKEERLIIKNFGPIKSIDIPIRKINVLIGDQGTGKSTVAKVLAIVKDLVFIINPNITTILNFYNLQHYVNVDSEIYFTSEHYEFKYNARNDLNIVYSNEFKNLFDLYKSELNIANQNNSSAKQLILNDIAVKMNALVGGVWYIPTERANINTHKKGMLNSQNYFQRFAENYETERNRISTFEIPFLDLQYSYQNNRDVIITKTGTYNLSDSASGFQSIVPAMMFAQFFVSEGGVGTGYYILEEPELNLFPKTQRDLINYLVGKIYTLNDYMFFTTHSPYILSSLNNLLYAFKIGQTNNNEVNTIIDKKYWVNPFDVSAYLLNDKGEAEDLMDYEINQIQAERIDEISRKINDEFDQLLKIEYSKK